MSEAVLRQLLIDDELLRVEIELWRGRAFLHAKFKRRFSSMRAARRRFPAFKQALLGAKHDSVFVCVPEGDEMLEKCCRLFGFSELEREAETVFMSQQLEKSDG